MQNDYMNLVCRYIFAYNACDIDTMLDLFNDDCIFEDISNSRGITRSKGKEQLKKMALQSKEYFSYREQKIINAVVGNNKIALEILYNAIVAVDLPNGLKKGDKLVMRGASFFEFKNDKIAYLTDLS